MREIDTVSPVVWPAWCYSGEGQADSEPVATTGTEPPPTATVGKSRGKKRAHSKEAKEAALFKHLGNGNGFYSRPVISNEQNNNNSTIASGVKSERLSPPSGSQVTGGGGNNLDNASSSSRSGTPSSSYPGTPPGGGGGAPSGGGGSSTSTSVADRASTSPSPSGHLKHMEHMMSRNYSDFMRSLAAKYNNTNPNEYMASGSGRNGLTGLMDPRFSYKAAAVAAAAASNQDPATSAASALLGLGLGLGTGKSSSKSAAAAAIVAAAADADKKISESIYAKYNAFPNNPYPPVDVTSTHALLSLVRSTQVPNASQLESYLKGAANKRPASDPLPSTSASSSAPLDLSSSAPAITPPFKRQKVEIPRSMGIWRRALSPKNTSRAFRAAAAAAAVSIPKVPCVSTCLEANSIASWSVDDVVSYVSSIDICSEYAPNFREQRIDGSSLPLLTEEHLTCALGMRLGPALRLRANLAQTLGRCVACSHCAHCHAAPSDSGRASAASAASEDIATAPQDPH